MLFAIWITGVVLCAGFFSSEWGGGIHYPMNLLGALVWPILLPVLFVLVWLEDRKRSHE